MAYSKMCIKAGLRQELKMMAVLWRFLLIGKRGINNVYPIKAIA